MRNKVLADATPFVSITNNLETRPDIDEIKIDAKHDVFTAGMDLAAWLLCKY